MNIYIFLHKGGNTDFLIFFIFISLVMLWAWPGIEPLSAAVEAWSPNCWTTREVLVVFQDWFLNIKRKTQLSHYQKKFFKE